MVIIISTDQYKIICTHILLDNVFTDCAIVCCENYSKIKNTFLGMWCSRIRVREERGTWSGRSVSFCFLTVNYSTPVGFIWNNIYCLLYQIYREKKIDDQRSINVLQEYIINNMLDSFGNLKCFFNHWIVLIMM